MPYPARKITRATWNRSNDLAQGEIPADAVTADLRTTHNTLSFWKCETASDDHIRNAVLALATAAERIEHMDLVWVEEGMFHAHGIAMNPSEGRTPVVSLRNRHIDVTKLDLVRLGKVATLLDEALSQNQFRRFTKKEIRDVVLVAVQQNLVSIEALQPKVQEEVGKAIAR